MALRADGDFAVVSHANIGLLAPDKGPPRTGWDFTQNGTFLSEGFLFGRMRGDAQFAVDFVLVDVWEQLIQEPVGPFEFHDTIRSQQRWQAFLPIVVAAFNFAFGLGSWSIAESYPVEVQGGSQLGEGFWSMSEEKGVVVHIEGQRQTMGLKGARQKVQVIQEGFGMIEAGTDIITGGIVQKIKQDLLVA